MPHKKAASSLRVYIPYPLSAFLSFSNINSYLFLLFFLSCLRYWSPLLLLSILRVPMCSWIVCLCFCFSLLPIVSFFTLFPASYFTHICILVPRLVFNTNSTSSLENRFVDGIVGMQVPLLCQGSVLWIATSNFLRLKTPTASSIRLHDIVSFSLSSLLIYFPYLLGSFQKLLSFFYYLINAPYFILFKKIVHVPKCRVPLIITLFLII